jgi:hypothetical protein
VGLAREALAWGQSVVIGLQSTGEGAADVEFKRLDIFNENKLIDLVSAPTAMLRKLVFKVDCTVCLFLCIMHSSP